jgi:microcystin degradation protein MlrC
LRVAIGGFGAESNSFSVEMATKGNAVVDWDRSVLANHRGRKTVIGGFIDALEEDDVDVEIIPTLNVWWGATGVITKESYEYFTEEILSRLRDAGSLHGVLLNLHGAMVAEGSSDGEGVFLKEIRDVVGEKVPIICVMDLHANISDLKIQMADAIFGYRTNPHIDLYERALKAGRTLLALSRCEVRPVIKVKRLPMLGHNLGMSTQSHDPEIQKDLPMVKIMEEVSRLEKESGILDISVFVGFAHADVQECGTSILVIGDDKPILAQSIAEKIAQMVWEARLDFYNFRPLIPVEKAVQRAMESQDGPIILVDVADNSGGGAPCDNTVILETLLKKGAEDAVVPLRDPEAVAKAFEYGVGSNLELDVGGKIDKRFYKPIRVKVEVKLLSDGKYVIRGPHHGGYNSKGKILPKEAWKQADVGRMALLKTDGIEIIVSEGKVSMERDYYKAAGVDPSERKIVVVRSAQAHRASFEGISKEIIEVDTPGPCSAIYRGLIFKNVERPIFPLDEI